LNHYVGVALTPEPQAVELFRSNLGNRLYIHKIHTNEGNKGFQTFDHFPRIPRPSLRDFKYVFDVEKDTATNTESFVVKYPSLGFSKQHFTTRINVLAAALKSLKSKESISIEQLSTCTLTVKFGTFEVVCNYSFPVDYNTTKLRVSRIEGWVEVKALLVSQSNGDQFISTPFPIVRSGLLKSKIRHCFFPSVNFSQLAPLDSNDPKRGDILLDLCMRGIGRIWTNFSRGREPCGNVLFSTKASPYSIFIHDNRNNLHRDKQMFWFPALLYSTSNSCEAQQTERQTFNNRQLLHPYLLFKHSDEKRQ